MPYTDPIQQIEYNKKYLKKHYQEHKDYYRLRNLRRKSDLRIFVDGLKCSPCYDCGGIFPPYVMDFDHRENKKFGIATAISRMISKEKILAEISKCDLVCANCHRIRTYGNKDVE